MPGYTSTSEGKRPLEVTLASILCWVIGGSYILFPALADIFPQRVSVADSSFVVSRTGMGMSLVLAGVGLWRMRQWWMLPYGMFIGARTAIRFVETFTGSFTLDLVSHVGLSLVWVTLGIRMLRPRSKTSSYFCGEITLDDG